MSAIVFLTLQEVGGKIMDVLSVVGPVLTFIILLVNIQDSLMVRLGIRACHRLGHCCFPWFPVVQAIIYPAVIAYPFSQGVMEWFQ